MKTQRDHQELEKRRLRSVGLFKKGLSAAEVGRRLGVSRQVAHRWKQFWQDGGKAALCSKGKAGRKAKVNAAQKQEVIQALITGPLAAGYHTDLWTLPRVSILIEEITGVTYHPGHVWRVLGAWGFSCQRPERRALERDEKAIATWKRKTWPMLKKTPKKSAAPSSLSTKAD